MKGWTNEKLEDLCIIGDGNHSSRYPKQSEMVAYGVPFIRGTNLVDGHILGDDILYISEEKHQELKKGHLKTDDVLFTNRGEIGKVAIVDEAFNGANLNSQIAWLRCQKQLLPKYLFFFLQSNQMRKHFSQQKSGAALQQFTIRMIKAVVVPYPPICEQKRIVTILEEAFEGIDRAIANTEKNVTNSRELFKSYLNAIFTQRGDGWEKKTLQQISIKFARGKSKHRPRGDKKLYGGKYPLIQTGDISNAKHRITTYSQTYNELGLAQSEIWPQGTVCIAIVGANVAETAILDFDACFPDSVIGIVVNEEVADSDYVEYLLQYFKAELKEKGKGTARDNINLGTFANQKFPFPDVKTQKIIAGQLEELSFETQRLEAIYRKKIAALNELKQSILQKAFTGELTADTANQTTKADQEVNAA